MKPFILSLTFKTPIHAGQDPILLDAIVAGALIEQGQIDDPSEIPFANTNGVPHASQLFLDHTSLSISSAKTRVFRDKDIPGTAVEIGAQQKLQDNTSDIYDNIANTYRYRAANSGAFIGCGDVDEIDTLFADIPAIGKRRRDGWGLIEEYSVSEMPSNHKFWGLCDADKKPVRCVPEALWNSLALGPSRNIEFTRARPFYWDDRIDKEVCVIPEDDSLDKLVL